MVTASIDVSPIDARIHEVFQLTANQAYQKQKCQLHRELEEFLSMLPAPKTMITAVPHDILRFLVWKDRKGKTKIHTVNCPFIGSGNRAPCQCPSRLAAGTVDNVIGKLRAIFRTLGRASDWNELTREGNPASSDSIKGYLKSIRWEQAQARTPCKQAVLLFIDKFKKVTKHLRNLLGKSHTSPLFRYIYARDLAFFTLAFSSGGRVGDLGRLKTIDLLGKPGDQHWLIHQRIGKTIRGKNTRVTPILRMSDATICPISNILYYGAMCKVLNVELGSSFIFRPTTADGRVKDEPFLHHAAQERLRSYLVELNIYEGETPHSFRCGTAIMLRLLGASKDQVADHLGWQSTRMVQYYTQVEKVLGLPGEPGYHGGICLDNHNNLQKLCSEFQERNMLREYVPVLTHSP